MICRINEKKTWSQVIRKEQKPHEVKLSVRPELRLTEEDQDGADPLHGGHDVAEQNDGAEDGEELSRGGDDGAGQGPKVHHRHKDKGLGRNGALC